jgi:phosphatidylserine decarboxylase
VYGHGPRLQYPRMRIDPAGWPFVLGTLVPAVVLVVLGYPWWALPFAVLAGFFVFFFRDPERDVSAGGADVLSPADGRVVVAGEADTTAAPPGDWRQVSIFLSPMDVHVNRAPISGRVTRVEYRPGKFLPAYRPDAAADNERNEVWIDHDGQTVVCRQVVGILARRIVCRVSEGHEVTGGQRFGVMKFGSRIDLFVPPASTLRVQVGDRVRSGVTVVATLPAREA